jgi:Protein of unknown function (DUF3073)
MGRGRQKAKHTKVARDLKYFSPDTNYDSLAKELGTSTPGDPRLAEDLEKWPEFAGNVDPYADEYSEDEFESDDAGESKSA